MSERDPSRVAANCYRRNEAISRARGVVGTVGYVSPAEALASCFLSEKVLVGPMTKIVMERNVSAISLLTH